MSIEIKEIEKDRTYTVNGKPVYRDMESNWIASEELTSSERKEFTRHLCHSHNEVIIKSEKSTGFELIKQERQRQITEENFTTEHDALYTENELLAAGYCYMEAQSNRHIFFMRDPYEVPAGWPWEKEWWKPSPDDRIKELKKAGALFCAHDEIKPNPFVKNLIKECADEIDRLLALNKD